MIMQLPVYSPLNMDKDIIWGVIQEGIPQLKEFCDHILESEWLEVAYTLR